MYYDLIKKEAAIETLIFLFILATILYISVRLLSWTLIEIYNSRQT